MAFGLNQSNADPGIYYWLDTNHMLIIEIWVDYGLESANHMATINKTVNFQNQNFEMDYRPADQRDRIQKSIFLAPQQYIEKLLSKFNLSTCHSVALSA
jgi:hypothetical protein